MKWILARSAGPKIGGFSLLSIGSKIHIIPCVIFLKFLNQCFKALSILKSQWWHLIFIAALPRMNIQIPALMSNPTITHQTMEFAHHNYNSKPEHAAHCSKATLQ